MQIWKCWVENTLGIYLHGNMNFDFTSDVLSSAGSKALGQLRHKFRFLKEYQYETFTKWYSSCIAPDNIVLCFIRMGIPLYPGGT